MYCHSIHVSLLWLFLCPSASLPLPILTTNDLKIINICCGVVRYNGLLASIMLFTSCHFLLSAHMGWWWCGYITATHKCVHKFVVYDCPACTGGYDTHTHISFVYDANAMAVCVCVVCRRPYNAITCDIFIHKRTHAEWPQKNWLFIVNSATKRKHISSLCVYL